MRVITLLTSTALLMAGLALTACASASANPNGSNHSSTHAAGHHEGHAEPRPYIRTANAHKDVRQAFERATLRGTKVILVMGANWCHDSRALAANFQTPLIKPLIEERYELVYVDVGEVQRGPRDLNIDIAQRYGISEIVGTPTILILSSDGQLLNKDSAPTWRNAASRSVEATHAYFEAYAVQGP